MKLTFKQRIIALFTGKLPEPFVAVDTTALKLELRPDNTTVAIPRRRRMPRTTTTAITRTRRIHESAYAPAAKECRKKPQQWQQVSITPVSSTANALASRIRHGSNVAFKKPRGGYYEARTAAYMGEYLVEARFIPNNKKEGTK